MSDLATELTTLANDYASRDPAHAALLRGIAQQVGRMEARLDEYAEGGRIDARGVGLRPVSEAVERVVGRARR